jgi:cyclopropane fatty-acyl-phospholipid synthase-like methyltransferase
VERIENIGGHYSKALRLWKEDFLANFDDKIRPALRKEHPEMTDEEMDVFRRKWEVRVPLGSRWTVHRADPCSTISHIARPGL